jgi:hypothetical protein
MIHRKAGLKMQGFAAGVGMRMRCIPRSPRLRALR